MKMLINSQWVEASGGAWMEIRNPGTGDLIDKVPAGTVEDANRAVDAAQASKKVMGRLPAFERAAILNKIALAIEAHQ